MFTIYSKNNMVAFYITMIILQVISTASVIVLAVKYIRLKKQKENEYYTDYFHGNLILRIYKPEFEYQAVGNVPREKLLDRGNFSQFYIWTLMQK